MATATRVTMVAPTQLRKGCLLLGSVFLVYTALSTIYTAKVDRDWLRDNSDVVISREYFQYLVSQLRGTPYPGVDSYIHYVTARSQLKPIDGVRALRPDFGPVVNDVESFRYPIEIPSCRIDVTHRTSLFVAVISAPGYFDKRQMIRQTWLSQLQSQSDSGSLVKLVGHCFFVGKTLDRDTQRRIEAESASHGDILQMDRMDTYYNLTQKVVALMNWINGHCSKVDFIWKVDDDVYVNVRNLATAVRALEPSEPSVYGTAADGVVQREGKFYISWEEWPWSRYPVYSMGASVIIPGSAVASLLAATQTIPYFPFEDTYLIGLCASKAGLRVRLCDRVLADLTTTSPPPCQVYQSVTWLTDSVDTLNKSHWATEDFYKNLTHCITKDAIGRRVTVDPTKSRDFLFTK